MAADGGQRQGPWDAALAIALRKRPLDGEPAASLRRRLNALDLTLIGVGASVGSGIFVITGIAAKPTGPGVVFSFLIEFIAVLFGLNVLVDYHVGAALGVLSCASYLRSTLALAINESLLPSTAMLSLLLVILLTCILCAGVERSLKQVNGVLVFGKVAIVLLIIAAGLFKVDTSNLTPLFPNGFGPVASMSATCSFSFIGFGTVTNAAEECVNPQRDLPLGITLSLLICAMLYIAFSLILVGIIPYESMDEAAPAQAAFGPRYANIPWVCVLVDWGAIIGLFTTLISGMYSQARMYLAMARDKVFFQLFGYVSTRYGTPVYAQIFCGIIAAALATLLPLEKIVEFLNIGVLLSYTIVCAGVLVLRSDQPGRAAVCSGVGTLVSVLASLCSTQIHSFGDWACWGTGLFMMLLLTCWIPLFRCDYCVPASFACPMCPLVPVLGLTVNGYLLSQCHWQAWLRLALTTLLILVVYGIRVRQILRSSPTPDVLLSLPRVDSR
eukprot:TRINITY_DN12861_c0_g1_i2.p1 TRINITY_DN12861_c0_g1~~TRINITY_DN12861_c0_g1_i2.p1  ORF type:complete len:498 (+),score=86.32 TRINITY_DN12861_c0_g1_i2:50-1543(+)